MKKFAAFITCLIALTFLDLPSHAIKTNPEQQRIWNLTACKSKSELDCVHSVSIWMNGKKVNGRQVSINQTNYRNEFGTPVTGGLGVWAFPGLAGTSTLEARLESPKHIIWIDPSGEKMRGSSLRVYLDGAATKGKRKIEVSVRTSWIVPMDVQLHADESDWSRTKYRAGHIWRVEGVPSKISGYNGGNWLELARSGKKADWDAVRWGFLIHHAAPAGKGGYFGDKCSEAGFSVEAHNAPGAGMPMWDEYAETLRFNILAAVYDRRGKKVEGKFKLWMSTAYVQCMWPGSTLGMAKTLSVSVVNQDGEDQAVNSWSLVDTGMFRIEVNGFDYGDTSIKIKPLRISRICQSPDGTQSEVIGLDPKCPEGTDLVG